MATNDLLSPDEARQALSRGVTDSDKQAVLDAMVTAVSQKLVQAVGPVVQGTVTAELHCGGSHAVWLKQFPVVSVVQVVEYDNTTAGTLTAETNSSKPDTAYAVNRVNGQLIRRSANSTAKFPVGLDNVLVTYVAGRVATTALVEERYKEAARLTLKNLWRRYENSVVTTEGFESPMAHIPSFAIPNAAKALLADQWREGVGV